MAPTNRDWQQGTRHTHTPTPTHMHMHTHTPMHARTHTHTHSLTHSHTHRALDCLMGRNEIIEKVQVNGARNGYGPVPLLARSVICIYIYIYMCTNPCQQKTSLARRGLNESSLEPLAAFVS